ncbi:GNAT family N-acetyltransferase [Microbacterium sp. SD291]|uniref:GNAT family N-acetyltransferase n=1 Tax=Microbacterium sp. SD291 TaxID=2782007 RepID=UPI001A965DD4|nr:GNAT family N-acetyltransferase [Microbacterium sp. SD291]MBO0979810.1 GNAT family N-acetyltransferase [Microbacterium sp. SD291]
MSLITIRHATAADAELIQAIETSADALLIDTLGTTAWPPAGDGLQRVAAPGFVLVLTETAEGSPVGFVHVMDADGHAHLEQLSVLPDAGRQGYGRRLVAAAQREARERGYTRMTLRTYAEVPWNAPFYASCGFLESLPETPFLRTLTETESRLGLDAHARRVQMTVEL